jgi:hypothetical protein
MDTLANPFKQASLGIVRGVSKIGDGLTLVSDSVTENAGKLFRNQFNRMNSSSSQASTTTTTPVDNEQATEVNGGRASTVSSIDIDPFSFSQRETYRFTFFSSSWTKCSISNRRTCGFVRD